MSHSVDLTSPGGQGLTKLDQHGDLVRELEVHSFESKDLVQSRLVALNGSSETFVLMEVD